MRNGNRLMTLRSVRLHVLTIYFQTVLCKENFEYQIKQIYELRLCCDFTSKHHKNKDVFSAKKVKRH